MVTINDEDECEEKREEGNEQLVRDENLKKLAQVSLEDVEKYGYVLFSNRMVD